MASWGYPEYCTLQKAVKNLLGTGKEHKLKRSPRPLSYRGLIIQEIPCIGRKSHACRWHVLPAQMKENFQFSLPTVKQKMTDFELEIVQTLPENRLDEIRNSDQFL